MKPMTETLEEKLIRCGWVTNFNVKTLVRLIEEHFSSRIPSAPTPISVNDRLPGPEDCDEDGCVWLWNSYNRQWDLEYVRTRVRAQYQSVTHWLPYYAIQIPTYTKTGKVK